MNIWGDMEFFERLAKALAVHFGSNCEIAIHDLTNGLENTLAVIENGHVSGRSVGDSASEIVLQAMKNGEQVNDHLGYLARTKDGRLIKSSSIFIKDQAGHVTGLVGINYDITDFVQAKTLLETFVSVEETQNSDVITSNVSDLLDQLIEESYKHVGKPVALMSKDDKIKAIKYLDKKGAFLIKKAGDRVVKFYDISKYTLYNYLDAEE